MTPPRIVRFQYPLRNKAWGYPRGQERRVEPWVLHAIHITGNKNTASMPVGVTPGTGTYAEVAYMARERKGSNLGNSAHDYIARDGTVIACIPTRIAAWNNGALLDPNMELKSIQRIVKADTNPNEAYVRETESTGYPGSFPLTREQRETIAYLIARDSIRTGLAISRETVHMHRDLDSVNRASCPFTGDREKQLEWIIDKARDIKRDLKDPEPDPEPEPEPDPCEDAKAALEAAEGRIEDLEEQVAACAAEAQKSRAKIVAARDRAKLAEDERDAAKVEAKLATEAATDFRRKLGVVAAERDALEQGKAALAAELKACRAAGGIDCDDVKTALAASQAEAIDLGLQLVTCIAARDDAEAALAAALGRITRAVEALAL